MNLLVFALPEEDKLRDYNDFIKIYTGVGKVNAAYELTKAIYTYDPELVIIFGSAGGMTMKKGDIVECNLFYQLDMDCTPLGKNKFETPNEKTRFVHHKLEETKYSLLKQGVLGSSDTFITSKKIEHPSVDLVDMEGYALAKVCEKEKRTFRCFKYITDECDTNSPSDWKENLDKAAYHFQNIMKQFS